jgi:hypothetical protein
MGLKQPTQRQLAEFYSAGAGLTAASVMRRLIGFDLLAQKIEATIATAPAPIQPSFFAAMAPISASIVKAAPIVKVVNSGDRFRRGQGGSQGAHNAPCRGRMPVVPSDFPVGIHLDAPLARPVEVEWTPTGRRLGNHWAIVAFQWTPRF